MTRLPLALVCFAVGGTLALAEFINAIIHTGPGGEPYAIPAFNVLLGHTALFVGGCVLIAAGCFALKERTP